VLRIFDIDVVGVDVPVERDMAVIAADDFRYVDEWGIGHRKKGMWHIYPDSAPLAGEPSVADVLNHPWPVVRPVSVDTPPDATDVALRDEARRLRAETDYAIRLSLQADIFQTANWLCGDDFYTNLITNPDAIDAIFAKVTAVSIAKAANRLAAVGPDVPDIIQCTADDIGMQTSLFISPAMYRRFVKPHHKAFYDFVRSRSSARLMMHSDGAIYPILQDFIEVGAEMLNPIQIECTGMDDTSRLKREFGDRLVFWGGLDVQHILPFGTPSQMKDEVRRRLDDLAPGGGYIICPRGPIRPEVPPQNICAIYEACDKYGHY
jgi:uroporphyrinogen decarboxylase